MRDSGSSDLASALDNTDVAIEILSTYVFHRQEVREALDRGIRYACYPQLSAAYSAEAVVDEAAYEDQLAVDRAVASALDGASRVSVTSRCGTDVQLELRGTPIDIACRRANAQGAITYLAGQVSLYPRRDTLSGRVIGDGVLQHVARDGTPVSLKIEAGRVVEIEGGTSAGVLRDWRTAHGDPDVFAASRLSLGLNPCVAEASGLVTTGHEGAFVLGLGSQPPGLGIFGASRVRTAIHTDLISTRITLKTESAVPIDDGRVQVRAAPSSTAEGAVADE